MRQAAGESQAGGRRQSQRRGVRVNLAATSRCQVVGEGGNLGFTQPGRIEFARTGGRINTDAIDNSAGVDTSDHEVNIEILAGIAIGAGTLEAKGPRTAAGGDDRRGGPTTCVAHNYDQTLALSLRGSRRGRRARGRRRKPSWADLEERRGRPRPGAGRPARRRFELDRR